MKIVILGNGFDLGSGLPTTYCEYFEYYEDMNKNELRKIKDFLYLEKKSMMYSDSSSINNDLGSKYNFRMGELTDSLDEVTQPIIKFSLDNNISIWNILFWYLKYFSENDIKEKNWSDVELQISNLIEDFSSMSFVGEKEKIYQILPKKDELISEINFGSISSSDSKSENSYSENIFFKFKKDDRIKLICDSIIVKRYDKYMESSYLNILKKELILFENSFKSYIKEISRKMISSNRNNLMIYRDNFLEIARNKSEKSNSFFILNFNYTDFSSVNEKDNIIMERDKQKIKIKQMNVHGVYYSEIIFGVDQTDQDKEEFFQFTKTYRKMELQNEIPVTKLPRPDQIDEIIIYGHSLAIADYSYFHSIFDYYNIYGSEVVLNFSYSFYGSKDSYPEIKSKHVQNVMRLLKYYGDKMFDKERGRNLVHKMLLENRLLIKEIQLKDVEKS